MSVFYDINPLNGAAYTDGLSLYGYVAPFKSADFSDAQSGAKTDIQTKVLEREM